MLSVGDTVEVVMLGRMSMDHFNGRIGTITNIGHPSPAEWIGVMFEGPAFIAGSGWNEFYEDQLRKVG